MNQRIIASSFLPKDVYENVYKELKLIYDGPWEDFNEMLMLAGMLLILNVSDIGLFEDSVYANEHWFHDAKLRKRAAVLNLIKEMFKKMKSLQNKDEKFEELFQKLGGRF